MSSYHQLDDHHDTDSLDEFSGNMASIRVLPMQGDVSQAHHKRNSNGDFTGKFCNPWPSWRGLSFGDAYKAYMDGATLKPPPDEGEEETPDKNGRLVKVLHPEWEARPSNGEELDKSKAKVCWLGHAGTFVQLPWPDKDGAKGVRENEGVGILFDPIFSKRCSPVQWFGPARFLPPPCRVEELPRIHICLISHDHYDHLDYNTIMDLYRYNSEHIHFFVPLGVKKWFISCKIPAHQVIELDWHQEALIKIPRAVSSYSDSGYPPRHSTTNDSSEQEPLTAHYDDRNFGNSDDGAALTLKVICTPAQHRSGRGIFDHFKSLWSSWVVGVVASNGNDGEDPFADDAVDDSKSERRFAPQDGFRMFFAGDTGYRYAGAPKAEMHLAMCPAFQEIADRYGPMDLSCLPISTGSSLSFLRSILGITLNHYALTSTQHLNSWDAIQISRLMGSKATLAVHHSTFSPEDESRGNIWEFGRTAKTENVSSTWGDRGCFKVSDIGEVLYL